MNKIPYLIHITDRNGEYTQKTVESNIELTNFLHSQKVSFKPNDFAYLGDSSKIRRNNMGTTFEIEVLVEPDERKINGNKYITINKYCNKYRVCRQTVYFAMNDDRLKYIKVGSSTYVADEEYSHERKKRNV